MPIGFLLDIKFNISYAWKFINGEACQYTKTANPKVGDYVYDQYGNIRPNNNIIKSVEDDTIQLPSGSIWKRFPGADRYLLIQYGNNATVNTGTNRNTVTLPISYTTYFTVVTTEYLKSYTGLIMYERYCVSKTLSTFEIWVHDYISPSTDWFTIGY